MRQPNARGPAPLIVLLLCALGIAGVLAYQAQDAARSHRETAERALTEYASLAAEQFADHAQMALRAMQMMSLRGLVVLDGSVTADSIPSVDTFRSSARELSAWCRCLDTDAAYVRLDHRTGEVTTAGEPALMVDRWRESLGLESAPVPEEPAYGRAPLRDDRLAFYSFSGERAAVLWDEVEGQSRALFHYHLHDVDAQPLAAYALEIPTEALVGPMFRRVLRDTPLLPRSLIGDLPNDSVLTITVSDRAGNEVFRSGGVASSAYLAADTIAEPGDGLVARVALRPEIAGNLIIGGLPNSRLPLLLALLGLTAALMVGALVQLHRHQELVRTRGNFVAGVSHELRTPLTQIRLYADLLRSGELSADNQERSVRVIDQEARRLSHLVENILRFSSAGSGAAGGRPEPRLLAPVVREIVEDFRPLARARRAEIQVELDPEVSASIDTDAFRQMLLNLLDNAVKYGPAGQQVSVGLEAREGMAYLRVDDEGGGVPRDERELIWEPYRRLDGAIESGMGGSGIGLSVVRDLAALHGGRAWVTDAAGGGARFVIELPALSGAPHPGAELETT